jgi:hypothetical protein
LMVGVLGLLLHFVIGYTSEDGFRAWVSGVGRPASVVLVALAAAGAFAVAGLLLAKFHKQVGRPFRWLGRSIRGWVRGARHAVRSWVVRALTWLLEKAAGEEVEIRVGGEMAGEETQEIAERVRALGRRPGSCGRDYLVVLLFALAASRSRDPGESCELSAWQVFAHTDDLSSRQYERLESGCNALLRWGMLSEYKPAGGSSIAVWVQRDVWEADRRGALSSLVRDELERRGG